MSPRREEKTLGKLVEIGRGQGSVRAAVLGDLGQHVANMSERVKKLVAQLLLAHVRGTSFSVLRFHKLAREAYRDDVARTTVALTDRACGLRPKTRLFYSAPWHSSAIEVTSVNRLSRPWSFVALSGFVLVSLLTNLVTAADPWVVYDGFDGPGKGKHIVLVSGDEEYRSEEALPQLGKILAKHHGFKCTVLFAIDPKDGTINPNVSNIPGLEALETADLMIIFTRFRDLPDDQMKHIVDYVESGKPIIGLRTATHAFNINSGKTYAKYSWSSSNKEWDERLRPPGARRNLDQPSRPTRQAEHARRHRQGAREPPDPARHQGRRHLGPDRRLRRPPAAARRQPAAGAGPGARRHEARRQAGGRQEERPDDAGRLDEDLQAASGKTARMFCTTMGASQDFASEGLRRLLVNASYWCLGLEDKIAARARSTSSASTSRRPSASAASPRA